MRISAVNSNYSTINQRKLRETTTPITTPVDTILQAPTGMTMISFKGNPNKNPAQIGAYATESNFLGGIYRTGGLGDVAEALPEAIGNHGKEVTGKFIDARTFLPYYSIDSEEACIYVAKEGTIEKTNKWNEWQKAENAAKKLNKENTLPKPPQPSINEDYLKVAQDYTLKNGETFALITETGDNTIVKQVHFLEDAGLKGTVKRIGKDSLDMVDVPYRVFEVNTQGKRKDKIYLIHTPEVSSGKVAYGINRKYSNESLGSTAYGGSTAAPGGSTAYGGQKVANGEFVKHFVGNAADDMFYTEQLRAMRDSLEKMEGGKHNFNPQNLILHDRFANTLLSDGMEANIAGKTYWQGIKYVPIFHNPGRGYQGCFGNPLDFFRIIATEQDLANLKASPNYEKVKTIADKITQGTANKKECEQLYNFFQPYLKNFTDSEGCFNMTKIAIAGIEDNPDLVSPGHVSKNYGKEAANFATEDIAKGLTGDFQRLDKYIVSVTNGAKPGNMSPNGQYDFFGSGTLHKTFADITSPQKYTPYNITDSVDTIYNAKLANKKNLINIVGEATEKLDQDPDAIAKVFFNQGKMDGIRGAQTDLKLTLGGLSKYNEGDILFLSWGRPDPQKGLNTTAKAFRMLLEDESIPLDVRKKCKLLFGAGGGNDAWKGANGAEHPDWKMIQEEMKKIAEIEVGGQKGVFKNNACYVNGLFPNRLANCVDHGIFTSRYEPCGITPFECFATGTPVTSINTGGAPDFIKEGKTGFLTKEPFMLNPERLGLAKDVSAEVLDEARVENSAKQVKDKLKEYLAPIQDGTFEAKQKGFIDNCRNEKIQWHNNNAYNNGKSALEIYLKDKCRTQDNEVNGVFKSSGRGLFNENAFTIKKPEGGTEKPPVNGNKIIEFFRSKTGKIMLGVIAAVGIIGAGYAVFKKSKAPNSNDTTPNTTYVLKPVEGENKTLSAVV